MDRRSLVISLGTLLVLSTGSTTGADDTTPAAGVFEQAGGLRETRMLHSAVPLPDGRVLLIGGLGGDFTVADGVDFLASAEVWDPSDASSEPTGAMAEARVEHSATPLHDGRVLVVGGRADDGALASAEVWDPATRSFEPAGTLAEARFDHSATLLPDGRVLVIGGYGGGEEALISAEEWDPATATFEPAGALAGPRRGHSAVLLPEGRVLVIGGVDSDFAAIADAEVREPQSGAFEPAGSLAEARTWNSTTLLSDGRVLVVGGDGVDGLLASAEVWDPATGAFRSTGSLAEGRHYGTATRLPDDRVLVVGGLGGEWGMEPLAGAELWDPDTESFGPAGSLWQPRMSHTATAMADGRVLVGGGTADHTEIFAALEVWESTEH
jgi:hypothetical protein